MLTKDYIYLLLLPVLFTTFQQASAQDSAYISPEPVEDTHATSVDSVKASKPGLIDRIIGYFDDTNKEHSDKALDISFIGGPHYSNEKKFGLGILAAGIYSTQRSDSLTPPSNLTVYTDFSTSGFYTVGITGVTRFNRDRLRLNYHTYFESMPDKFWGIGYTSASSDDNETSYKRLMSEFRIDAQFSFVPGLYIGPLMEFTYIKGTSVNNDMLHLWQGEDMRTFSYGIGAKVSYDTRDNLTAPHRGVNISLVQRYYGKWMQNDYPFSSTEFTAAWYTPLWRDCTLAMQYHTLITYGDTPWGMLASMGGSYTMRGYFEGRYRDKGEMDFTAELRQRVWHRIGVAAWGGVGSVFPRLSHMKYHPLLPNFGVGFRWEFKKNVNVRLDMGFGKGEKGFVFNLNEAF